MAATVSWERLRELAGFRAANGCAITFYLGLDPSVAPTAGDAEVRVNSLLDEGSRSNGADRSKLTHEQRQGLKADFERIRSYVDNEFDRDGTQGLAIFADGPDNVWRTLALAEPVRDAVKVGRQFYLAPLVPLLRRGSDAIVCVVGRERGEILRLNGGRLEAVADHTEEQPSRHDQGGWSQANFQRHIDELAADHLRAVADELNRQSREAPGAAIVIVCSEELRGELHDLLAQETRSGLAGWASAEAHAAPAELLSVVTPVLEGWRARRESEILERWREEAGRDGRASAGWGPTLEAASDARVDVLLFQDGANRPGYQCPACGRASMEPGACPLDGTQLEEHDAAIDLAVHQTLAHGGSVQAVRHRQDLDPVEGIGALLRF
jgi:peptide chain release factor subunit 1